jgi:Tannase and feruloyl esterase
LSLRKAFIFFATLYALAGLFQSRGLARQSCQSLSRLKLPDTTITMAVPVPAGALALTNPFSGYRYSVNVPAMCRVAGTIKPAADSDIRFEVWMPSQTWNGRFDGVGNGAFAGFIYDGELAFLVRAGFAAAATDTGHSAPGDDARWALGHPEKVKDFGFRAVHLMTMVSKTIIQDFYGTPPRWSYFDSCSTGGRQALMEAQRFPNDYNGIIAGAPANFLTHLQSFGIWLAQSTLENPASYIPASKLPAIHNAVLAACDAEDGIKDGILNDPRQCHFNPQTLLCHGADSSKCLTAPQVAALKKIYAGPHNSEGKMIFPGFMPGSELGWAGSVVGSAPGKGGKIILATHFFSSIVFGDPKWNFRTFDFDRDVRFTDKNHAGILNATSPNLMAFRARGRKLMLFHGWSDNQIPPLNTVNYFDSVVAAMGQHQTESFVRLYMVPGMAHCGGGAGPDSFGMLPAANADPQHSMFSALERWVEHGVAPRTIIATKYVKDSNPSSGVVITRPLCPFPEIAKYKGSGDTHEAANFTCTLERTETVKTSPARDRAK